MATRRAGGAAGVNSMAAKRIRKEISDLARENLGSITLTPNESNIFLWRATLPGPAGSPYEGGEFEVDIRVPDDYPFSPPALQFRTKVYHCNIADTGAICLDLLKTHWSPALSLYKVILSLSSLLTDPNPNDPLVPGIAQEYKKSRKKHDQTAREWVKLYATPKTVAVTPPPEPAPPPARAPRPRPIVRELNGGSSTPPASVLGTRRGGPSSNSTAGRAAGQPIDLVESDEEEIEVLGDSNSGVNGATSTSASSRSGTAPRRTKRQRISDTAGGSGGAGGSDDVIVIDD